ncbi:HD domain-containing protein [Vibrio olivae]|uniref:HD domain-containing protein n=1 Tax=Vibrio olivae TaxID=1243002 RepID=A0ABV5HJK7_9VIBR
MERLSKQIQLVLELDKLKSILRRTRVKEAQGRAENSAEHSWHVAVMALLLEEHANEPVEISRVVKMLLIHDVVEIDAGDTFLYDTVATEQQSEKESLAAERLFGLLPDDQARELKALWFEFEQAQSADAQFAKALDRLIPMLLNFNNQGQSWQEHGISRHQVMTMNNKIELGSEALWQYAKKMIDQAVENGWLRAN